MNKKQQQLLLLAAARRKKEAAAGSDKGFLSGLKYGLDQPLENMGVSVEEAGKALGSEGLQGAGEWLRQSTSSPDGYQPASAEIGPALKQGNYLDALGYLPRAAVEQTGQMAGSLASRAAGAAAGAPAGPVGAAVGAFAGPAAFEAAQQLGPIALERAKNNGRTEPNSEDWAYASATALGSGAVNAIIPGGGSGAVKKVGFEAAGEAVQSGVEQVGASAGTEAGLKFDPYEAVAEGLVGGSSAGMIHGASEAASVAKSGLGKAASGIRYDNDSYDENDVELSERFRRRQNSPEQIGYVNDTSSENSAQGLAKGVLKELRTDILDQKKILQGIIKQKGTELDNSDAEALSNIEGVLSQIQNASDVSGGDIKNHLQNILNKATGQGSNLKASVSDDNIDAMVKNFGDIPEAQRMKSLLKQVQKITRFTDHGGDIGGISGNFTRFADPTDKRSGFGRMAYAAHGIAGVGSGFAGLAPAAGLFAVNRTARGIDRLTNTRSTAKRYVESVERSVKRGETDGRTNKQRTDELRSLVQQARADSAKREAAKAEAEAAKAEAEAAKAELTPNPAEKPQKSADQWHAEMHNRNTEDMFETGVIPKDEYFQPYQLWKNATGLSPDDTLSAIEQLEREGKVPEDTARRYREDIRTFAKDDLTFDIQQQVRLRANPNYSAVEAAAKEAKKSANSIVAKLDASKTGISMDRRKAKAKEGSRLSQNLMGEIEAASDNLTHGHYQALLKLKAAIDRPDMTAEMRSDLVDETLGGLFPEPVEFSHWHKKFSPLAAHGNDYVIERKSEQEQAEEDFDKKVDAVKRKASKKKKGKVKPEAKPKFNEDGQGEFDLGDKPKPRPKSKAEAILDKLNQTDEKDDAQQEFDFNKEADSATKAQIEDEPKAKPALEKSKGSNRNSIKEEVEGRVERIKAAIQLNDERGAELEAYVNSLPKSVEGRIEGLIYDLATDRVTANMLIDSFAERFNVRPEEAAGMVFDVLNKWAQEGHIKLFLPKGSSNLTNDQKPQKDADGNYLKVVQIKVLNEGMAEAMNVAKARNMVNRMVAQGEPPAPFTPDTLVVDGHKALKHYGPQDNPETFTPFLDFLNTLRQRPMAYSRTMYSQITKALGGSNGHVAPIKRQLKVATDEGVDESPLMALGQIMFQVDGSDDFRVFQEWFGDASLRAYSRNGSAHTQSGDLMKGMTSSAVAAPPGAGGMAYMSHAFGNLLGYDKDAPATRREAIFQPGVIDKLVKFANDPFGRTMLGTGDKVSEVGKLVDNGEGFFQVLRVANEVKRMVDFASEKFPQKLKKKDYASLLKDPEVQAALENGFNTDFIVQLDASNNAYQIVGLLLGDESILSSTGLRQIHDDPDTQKGADIYLDPARAIAERVPALKALGLPDSKLRKLFKNPIGTYLYAATFNSRRTSFEKQLSKIANGAPIFGVGEGDGLIRVDPQIVSNLASASGHTFIETKYDQSGEVTSEKPVRKRVVIGEGKQSDKFFVEVDASVTGKGFKKQWTPFDSFDDAAIDAYGRDFYVQLNRELVRDIKTRYPRIDEYLKYCEKVMQIVKDRGGDHVKIPTPDGMTLRYDFKEKESFGGKAVSMPDGRSVIVGFKTNDNKLTGRGLAAKIAHSLDAYVLRKSAAELGDMVTFNPIHDSYGFHPSDAKRGQEKVLEVLQSLGDQSLNMFEMLLDANGINRADFGIVPDRKHVQPQQAWQIPTALS